MKLNEKILHCRKKAGLSQEALAEELGVSRQAVSKWETGDAVPEIGKLVSLSKIFDVTTDWLLSEEEPENHRETEYNTYYQESISWAGDTTGSSNTYADSTTNAERFEKAADDWMDAVPGVLGKLVRRFGWIAGVYIAICGGGLAGVGLIAKTMVNSVVNGFNNAANNMMSGFGGFGGSSVTFYDANGNQLSASESAKIAEALGNSGFSEFGTGYGVDNFWNSGMSSMNIIAENNPVSVLASFLIVIGLIMLVAGIAFAVIWHKKSLEQK